MDETSTLKKQSYNIDIHGNSFLRIPLIVTMLIGSFIAVLNQTILATALPQLMNHFRINASQVQWVTTAYMLTNGIMIPMTALLLEKISTRKLFLFAMTIFGCGTALCALCPTFQILLAGRILQAVGAGILMPLVNTVFVLVFPLEKRGMAMGIYGLVISFGPALGPTLAGFIIDRFHWQFLFLGLLPVIVIDIICAVILMRDIVPSKDVKIDVLSLILSALGFGGMLFGFSSAGSRGWSSPVVYLCIILGSVIAALFVIRQLTIQNPMLRLRVFKSSTFTLTTLTGAIMNIAQVASTIIVPIFIQSVLGKSALTSGLVLLPGALIMAFVMLISGNLFDKYGAKHLVIPGVILITISTVPFMFLSARTSIAHLAVYNGLRFIGLGLIFMTLQTAGMNALPNNLIHHATAVINTSRQIMGSIGTAVLITIMSNVELHRSPAASLMQTNPDLYHENMLNATIHGMNVSFMCVLAMSLIGFICSLFFREPGKEAVSRRESA